MLSAFSHHVIISSQSPLYIIFFYFSCMTFFPTHPRSLQPLQPHSFPSMNQLHSLPVMKPYNNLLLFPGLTSCKRKVQLCSVMTPCSQSLLMQMQGMLNLQLLLLQMILYSHKNQHQHLQTSVQSNLW